MKGMLAPKVREVRPWAKHEVRQVYKISSVGTVAGCRVTDGKIARDAQHAPGAGRHRGAARIPSLQPEAL